MLSLHNIGRKFKGHAYSSTVQSFTQVSISMLTGSRRDRGSDFCLTRSRGAVLHTAVPSSQGPDRTVLGGIMSYLPWCGPPETAVKKASEARSERSGTTASESPASHNYTVFHIRSSSLYLFHRLALIFLIIAFPLDLRHKMTARKSRPFRPHSHSFYALFPLSRPLDNDDQF
jgi:hypothetical protein